MATTLNRVKAAGARARRLEAALDVARSDLYDALRAARAEGHSFAELGRTLGVTRQRVKQLVNRPPRG